MKIINSLKPTALILLIVGFVVGCAGTTEQEAKSEAKPESKPAVETKPAPAPVKTSIDYEVARGDNLWDISGKPEVYGNPYQWPLIYKANSDKIKDADLIYPGQLFGIGTSPSAAEVSGAVQHAKTRGSWSIGVVEESDKAYLGR